MPPYEYLQQKLKELPHSYYKLQEFNKISVFALAIIVFTSWYIIKLLLRVWSMRMCHRWIHLKTKFSQGKYSELAIDQVNKNNTRKRHRSNKSKQIKSQKRKNKCRQQRLNYQSQPLIVHLHL